MSVQRNSLIKSPDPPSPKGPCTHTVYTLALKYSLYRYIGPKVYAVWVHGPLGYESAKKTTC